MSNKENIKSLEADAVYHSDAVFVGRVWREDPVAGPCVVIMHQGLVYDITGSFCTVSDFFESTGCLFIDEIISKHEQLCAIEELLSNSIVHQGNKRSPYLLPPCDLQAIKACGVTFVTSLIERVIEEECGGDPGRAAEIREMLSSEIGANIFSIRPGSAEALELKDRLIEKGMWSQYLEVGIGPDAEVFTKSQVLSAVGHLERIGIHPESSWNNPEPEIVLAVNSKGEIRGVTLGNDVNLRDFEGRSALLLGRAKDNNGSCALGPFIRLLDQAFTLETVKQAEVNLTVIGEDGYRLEATSNMSEISRSPEDLVAQTINRNHQYPDGLMLFLGTMFAPTDDRGDEGQGFTHKPGDTVIVQSKSIGSLLNFVDYSDNIPEWTWGLGDFMRNLSNRKLI